MGGEPDRIGPAWNEDLLDPLGERDDSDARQIKRLHGRERSRELPLPTVDDDEIRRGGERLVVLVRSHVAQPCESPGDHLRHRGEVVHPDLALDPELPVVRLLGHAVPEDDHRADVVLSHHGRDVEALDPKRQSLEVEHLTKLFERLHPPQPLQLRLVDLRGECMTRVFGCELL